MALLFCRALISAAVIAFLSSFENYNTTTFAILADKTLVTHLAGQVRQGTTPALSALAVIIIGISLFGAIAYEIMKRREESAAERAKELGLRVLSATGSSLERDFPFGVVRQLFEAPLAALDDDERTAALSGAAAHAELADRAEDQVLRGDAIAELARVVDAHRLGLGLRQGLRPGQRREVVAAQLERHGAPRDGRLPQPLPHPLAAADGPGQILALDEPAGRAGPPP